MLRGTSWTIGIGAIVVALAIATSEQVVKRVPIKNRITVVYWEKWTGQEGEAMSSIVDDFNKSQDRIYVKILTISGVNDKTLLAANGGNPPDVAGMWGEQVTQFAENGAATDLTPYAKKYGLTEDKYIPVYWDIMNVNGKVFAYPTTPASTAMCVNRALMPPKYKDPKNFPQTLEELDALVKQISIYEKGKSVSLAGFLPGEPGWWNWAWGYYFGGKLMDGEDLTVNSEDNVKGFGWMASYAKLFGPSTMQNFQSGFGNFASPQNAFMSGKVAMVLQGVWMANYINLYQDKKKPLDWFAVPFPHPAARPDLAGVTFANFDTLVIPKGAHHPDEAFEFIAFVQSQKEMEKLCTLHGKNSPLKAVSEEFLKNHPNPFIRVFDALARNPNAMHAPKVGAWPQLNSELIAAVQSMNLGEKTPKEALDDVQARMVPALERYRRFVRVPQ